jgi:hypothetical protein
LFETQPATSNAQRYRDDEPDYDDDKHGGEWNRPGSTTTPDEQVEEEEDGEDEARKRKRRADEAEFPGLAVEELVSPGGHIATDESEKSVEDDDNSAERSAVAGREEAKESECCCNVSVTFLK